MATGSEIPDNRPMSWLSGGDEPVAPGDWPTGGTARRARKPRVVVVALVGSGVGVALYPLAVLLAQVLARSCGDGGLETVGSCLLGGLASLVLAAVILFGAAGLVLWRAGVRLAPVVAVLAFVTATLLAWRLLYAFNDLQAVLGRGVVWIGVIAFPMLFVGWFLLLRGGRCDSLVGLGEIVGVLLLLTGFFAPALVEGAERRQYESAEREWLASVPFTIYAPTDPPPGFSFSSTEGRFSSPPQVLLNYRGHEQSLQVIQSAPYMAFAPPRACGLGFPSDVVHNTPCSPIATMPSGEEIYFRFDETSRQPIYAVQLGSTVVTVKPPARAGTPRAPEAELVAMLRSLQPLPPGELAGRNRAARRR